MKGRVPELLVAHVVLIAGGSGSGKTTLARALAERTAAPILSVDSYYRGYEEIPLPQRKLLNFDAPDAIEHELLRDHLNELRNGREVRVPRYDPAAFARLSESDLQTPGSLVIVEGLFALHWPDVREIAIMGVYLDTRSEACLRRRLERDTHEFGRSLDDALLRYHTHVKPNHERYVAPTKVHADLHLDGTLPVADLVSEVHNRLSFLTMLTNA